MAAGLLGGNITGGSDHQVRLDTLVVTRPVPEPDTLRAVRDGVVHGEVLQVVLFVGNDDVNVVHTAETVIGDGKQAIDIRGKVDAGYVSALIADDINEARILVSKPVVVLTPDR